MSNLKINVNGDGTQNIIVGQLTSKGTGTWTITGTGLTEPLSKTVRVHNQEVEQILPDSVVGHDKGNLNSLIRVNQRMNYSIASVNGLPILNMYDGNGEGLGILEVISVEAWTEEIMETKRGRGRPIVHKDTKYYIENISPNPTSMHVIDGYFFPIDGPRFDGGREPVKVDLDFISHSKATGEKVGAIPFRWKIVVTVGVVQEVAS